MADKIYPPVEEILRRVREYEAKVQRAADYVPEDQEVVNRMRVEYAETVHRLERLHNPGSTAKVTVASHNDSPLPPHGFALHPLWIPDPSKIPHRKWLYGTQLIRGYVSLLVAPGGTGKSTLILGMAMALASNRNLLKTHVHQRCRVAILNLEDPQEEIDRRVAAMAMHYRVSNGDVDGMLFTSAPERAVTIASTDVDGFTVIHPDEQAIIDAVRINQIDVLAVDPFAESHSLEENSNPHMVKAAAAWRRVARLGGCSVLLSHHVRKGPIEGIDAARGAKALTDSARIGMLLSTMTETEAETLGVDPEQRLQYVRLDDAKANLARRAGKARWFRLADVMLNNACAPYAKGDEVGVVEAWEPPADELKEASHHELNAALDAIAAGPGGGRRYTDSRRGRGGGANWVGNVLCRKFETSDKEAAKMVAQWLRSGLLYVEEYRDPDRREMMPGVFVNDTRRPS